MVALSRIKKYFPASAFILLMAAAVSVAVQFQQAAADSDFNAKIKIAFLGDSTADGLWGGMTSVTSKHKCLKGAFDLGRFGKNSTGLTRPDKYDWIAETAKIVSRYKPNLILISLGLNDRQPIVELVPGGGRRITQYEAPEWPARYKENVMAVLRNATAANVPVLWVGLAAMRDAATNRDVQQKNQIFADAATELAASNVHFIAPWRLKETGEDVFASYAPGLNGKLVHIRTSDGEHFTSEGDELVSAYLLPKIVENLKASGTEVNSSCLLASE
jgi:hypothetical protein